MEHDKDIMTLEKIEKGKIKIKIKNNIQAIKHSFKITMNPGISLIISCFFLACNVCAAENELAGKSREANKTDLTGTWMMYYQTVSPLFRDNSLFFADYQIFQFWEDGYVKNIASRERLEPEKIVALLQMMPKNTAYGFVNEGVLIIERPEGDIDNIQISIAVADFNKKLRYYAPLIEKGDLIVSYFDNKKNLYMQRYLRRVAF